MIIHNPLCKNKTERNAVHDFIRIADYEFILLVKECIGCGKKQQEIASGAQFHRTVFLMLCDAIEHPYGILELFLRGSGYNRLDLAWALGVTYSAVEKWARNLRKTPIPRYSFITLRMLIEGYPRGPDVNDLTQVMRILRKRYNDTWRDLSRWMGVHDHTLHKLMRGEPAHPAMMPFLSYYREHTETVRKILIADPIPLKKQEYIIG